LADPKILTGDQVAEYLTCTLLQKRKALCIAWVYEALKVKKSIELENSLKSLKILALEKILSTK